MHDKKRPLSAKDICNSCLEATDSLAREAIKAEKQEVRRLRDVLEKVHKELTRIQASYAKSGTKNVTCLTAGSHLRHLSHLCTKALTP